MTYLRIEGCEVMGLTADERQQLHPQQLGRTPTWDDVHAVFQKTLIGPPTHHLNSRKTCDGCTSRVFTWAEELDLNGITGRRFCSTCAKHRSALQ
jgi:hypothetical protein